MVDKRQLLRILEDDGRIDFGDLAIMVGADVETVLEEIAQMERERVICGYRAVVDWERLKEST
jgi:DNA-binding Lrp family transcriptional regulator